MRHTQRSLVDKKKLSVAIIAYKLNKLKRR